MTRIVILTGCRKSPLDFFNSLHNASLFCPRIGPKSCRCAAQTPADTGFLQAFNPTRGGSRPLVLPLQKRTLFLQTGFFDKLSRGTSVPRLRLSKKSIDFSDSLPNVSIFGPRSGPKICRCAAQTPANAGFLQTFDSIRRGSRPLVLPLQKRTSFLQTGDFRQAERRNRRFGFSSFL